MVYKYIYIQQQELRAEKTTNWKHKIKKRTAKETGESSKSNDQVFLVSLSYLNLEKNINWIVGIFNQIKSYN